MKFEEDFQKIILPVDEKILKTENTISENPHDFEAWNILIKDLQDKDINEAALTYERLVSRHPSSSRLWKNYIEHEMKFKRYDEVQKLFRRCLTRLLHIDIWKLYLSYIKETKTNGLDEEIIKAFDFTIDKVGTDIHSYPIWMDYINYLKSVETQGSYAEIQKVSAMRKVYHKGILNPMMNIELFWKDYCNFENGINQLNGKKMQEDRSRDYANAKRVAKELETITKGINKNAPSVPPRNTPEEMKQVELWKKYIQWEKNNPLRTEDQTITTKRVMFAYEQCFLCLGLHPDIWIEAAIYLEDSSKLLNERGSNTAGKIFAEEASNIFERALSMGLKNCLLIYFAYADMEESRMKYDKVHSIYKRALELNTVETTLVYIQYMRFARRAEGIKSARAVFKLARDDPRIKYHIYVAAARMESNCSNDNKVALNIFELAFKKFGGQYEFVKEYLDYSMSVNDDKNTRVLFERIINSGLQSKDIWDKFLEFEAHHGCLSNISESEKRRLNALEKEFEGNKISLTVNKYKFLDLLPCTSSELEAFCIRTSPDSMRHTDPSVEILKDIDNNIHSVKKNVFLPDVSQMIPYTPDQNSSAACYTQGNDSNIPPGLSEFMKLLQSKSNFVGPFIRVQQFMENLSRLEIPNDCSLTKFEHDLPNATIQGAIKRKHAESDDEEDCFDYAPQNLFQARQQQKIKC